MSDDACAGAGGTVRIPVAQCTADHVTVYSDRAEVSRVVVAADVPIATGTEGEQLYTIVVEGVTGDADADSIRVKAHAESAPCTILEVSVEERVGGAGETQGVREARAALAAARRARAILQDNEKRVRAEQELIKSYMNSMLAPGVSGVHFSPSSGSGAASPPIGADLDALEKLLDFHSKKRTASDARLLELKDEISAADDKIHALEVWHNLYNSGTPRLPYTKACLPFRSAQILYHHTVNCIAITRPRHARCVAVTKLWG